LIPNKKLDIDRVKLGLFWTDHHYPYEDKVTMVNVEKYLAEKTFDYVIYGGDICDFDFISKFSKDSSRQTRNKSFIKQYDTVNAALDRHQALQSTAQFVLLEGNHDYRAEAYLDSHEESEGVLEVEKGLHLKERGIKWVRSWSQGEIYTIGKASFSHGVYCNDLHAKRHATQFGHNLFYGHTHDFQQYAVVRLGDDNTFMGQSCGCLQMYRPDYIRGKPTRWQQGFVEFHFWPNGNFNFFPVLIFNHSFIAPDGTYYGSERARYRRSA
jgi:predicted phosphodiesterase